MQAELGQDEKAQLSVAFLMGQRAQHQVTEVGVMYEMEEYEVQFDFEGSEP